MGEIGLSGQADLSLMDLGGKNIGFFNQFNVGLGPIGKNWSMMVLIRIMRFLKMNLKIE